MIYVFCRKSISIWACFFDTEKVKGFRMVHILKDPDQMVGLKDITISFVNTFKFPYKEMNDRFRFHAPKVGQPVNESKLTVLSSDDELMNYVKSCADAGCRSVYLFLQYVNVMGKSNKVENIYKARKLGEIFKMLDEYDNRALPYEGDDICLQIT